MQRACLWPAAARRVAGCTGVPAAWAGKALPPPALPDARPRRLQDEVTRCYDSAMRQGLYDKQAYIAKNKAEYWAEASQAWFEATVRTDVTSGVRCKAELVQRDPDLARLMLRVYGDNAWVYMDSAPGKFRSAPPRGARMGVAEVRQRLGGGGGHGGPARPAAAGGAPQRGGLGGMLSSFGSKAKDKLAAFSRATS